MSPDPAPIADPHEASPAPRQKPSITRARGCALPILVALGCLSLAFGIVITLAALGGLDSLPGGSVRAVEPEAVLETLLAAVFGVACCWGGYHFLRLAFGNQG